MELELVPYVFAQKFDIQDLSPCQIEVKKVISVPFQLFWMNPTIANFQVLIITGAVMFGMA